MLVKMKLSEYLELEGATLEFLLRSSSRIFDDYNQSPFESKVVGTITTIKKDGLNKYGDQLYNVLYSSGVSRSKFAEDWMSVQVKMKLDITE